jgi:hypothetical protein
MSLFKNSPKSVLLSCKQHFGGQAYKQFVNDLKIGQLYEKIAIEHIIKFYKGKYQLVETNDDSRYDFILSNNKTYEVKALLKVYVYQNIFVEYIAFKKPSGIQLTHANFYVFVLIDKGTVKQTIIISTAKLKRLISEGKYMKNYVDKLKAGYIFSLQLLFDQSLIVFDCA